MKRSAPLLLDCTMDTHSLMPLAGVLVAAAITPGPNNFIVMEAGARGGLVSAGRVALGVILGSVLLLAVILAGVGRALEQSPRFGAVLSLAGGTYLAWLGASLFLRANGSRESACRERDLPSSLLGVAAFQLANPKAWILVTTAAATVAGTGGALQLALMLVLVSGVCLSVWGIAGAAAARLLARHRFRLWFDRSMGVLLATSAFAIVAEALA
jgi:threonine/homoserine/homoserine lactone efflux protein